MLCDDRQDRSGGIHYNQFDRVRIETTWRLRLRKEREVREAVSAAGATGTFQMNLVNCCDSGGFSRLKHSHNRMELVTEKEIKQSPAARTSLKGLDPESMEVMAVKHLGRRPTDKWDVPMTTSQESGWLLANPVRADSLILPPWQRQTRRSAPGGPYEEEEGPTVLPPMSLTLPANSRVLERIKSAPQLPTGPPAPQLAQLNNRRWHRPKGKCDVTTYSEAYITMNHFSPFSVAASR